MLIRCPNLAHTCQPRKAAVYTYGCLVIQIHMFPVNLLYISFPHILYTRSLGALQALTSSWRPLVLTSPSRTFGALKLCAPCSRIPHLVFCIFGYCARRGGIAHTSSWMFPTNTFLLTQTAYTTILAAPSSTFFSDLNSKSCHESPSAGSYYRQQGPPLSKFYKSPLLYIYWIILGNL